MARLAVLLGALSAVAAMPAAAAAAPYDTLVVSRLDGAAGAEVSADNAPQDISADGRYVLFDAADRLLYVRDVVAGTTEIVSRKSGAAGVIGIADGKAQITTDGRYVAFTSRTNLDPDADCSGLCTQVYRRDRVTGETLLVSRAAGAHGADANDVDTTSGAISDDGRYIVFDSGATNLGEDQTYPPGAHALINDVFVRDLQQNTTELISRGTGAAAAPGDAHSAGTSISADGRYVVFSSAAKNISGEDADGGFSNVYVRDRVSHTTSLVSRQSGVSGAPGDDWSHLGALSADGSTVVFESSAKNLSAEDSDVPPVGGLPPPIGGPFDIFARDLHSATTTLVSRADGVDGAAGNLPSTVPSVSAHGDLVAFLSAAGNFSGEDWDSGSVSISNDVFLRDLRTGRTWIANRASGITGVLSNGGASSAVLSDDGRMLTFASNGTNLANDGTLRVRTYRRDVSGAPPPDADRDGIPDALDACPTQPGPGLVRLGQDYHGCPTAPTGGGSTGGGPPGTGQTPPPSGGHATLPRPSFAGTRRSVRVRKGRFPFSFRARPGLSGRVTVSFMRVLATRTFHVGPTGKVRLTLHLSRRGRALLRRRGSLRTTVRVLVRDASGATAAATRSLKLKR